MLYYKMHTYLDDARLPALTDQILAVCCGKEHGTQNPSITFAFKIELNIFLGTFIQKKISVDN